MVTRRHTALSSHPLAAVMAGCCGVPAPLVFAGPMQHRYHNHLLPSVGGGGSTVQPIQTTARVRVTAMQAGLVVRVEEGKELEDEEDEVVVVVDEEEAM